MANVLGRMNKRFGEPLRPLAIVLQQVKRHPLRRLGPDAREATQRLGERIET